MFGVEISFAQSSDAASKKANPRVRVDYLKGLSAGSGLPLVLSTKFSGEWKWFRKCLAGEGVCPILGNKMSFLVRTAYLRVFFWGVKSLESQSLSKVSKRFAKAGSACGTASLYSVL